MNQKKSEHYLDVKRNYPVVKHNRMVRDFVFSLTATEQKIIAFAVQQIKPDDKTFNQCTFSVKQFSEICGIEPTNHTYYKSIIKKLADQSWWVEEASTEKLMRWFDTCEYNKASGKITLFFSRSLEPYLIKLQENYTQYSLSNILPMRSAYSIRLYEYLKSYAFQAEQYHTQVEAVDDLKKHTGSEKYEKWYHWHQKVLQPAIKEINEYSDLLIEYSLLKEGRSITAVKFTIEIKGFPVSSITDENNKKILNKKKSRKPIKTL